MMYALGVKYKKNADGFFSSILLFILNAGPQQSSSHHHHLDRYGV
jgi:hypothetical protein